MFYIKICFISKYVLYQNMLIFGDFFKKQSDQNIHQNAPKCIIFSKISRGSYSICPLTPLAYARNTHAQL